MHPLYVELILNPSDDLPAEDDERRARAGRRRQRQRQVLTVRRPPRR